MAASQDLKIEEEGKEGSVDDVPAKDLEEGEDLAEHGRGSRLMENAQTNRMIGNLLE